MQPFVQLGLRLQRDGHRVRLATHACFRDYVQGKGLEFYPLAGDPLKLSEFMVKTQGFVIPTTPELLMQVCCEVCMLVIASFGIFSFGHIFLLCVLPSFSPSFPLVYHCSPCLLDRPRFIMRWW